MADPDHRPTAPADARDALDAAGTAENGSRETSPDESRELREEPNVSLADSSIDYEELELNVAEQYRRDIRALIEHSRTVHADYDPWDSVPAELRERAKQLQAELDELITTGYSRDVEPRHGHDDAAEAWRSFQRWRDRTQDEYSRLAFGERVGEHPGLYLTAPQNFPEDARIREEYFASEMEEVFQSGAVPRKASVLDAVRRSEDLASIGPPYAERYRDSLGKCNWRWVFHCTRLEHLPLIGVYGLVPGFDAVRLSPRQIERASRAQSNAEKERHAGASVCSSFFPQDWTYARLGGEENSVIVALNAETVCLRRRTRFFPLATRSRGVTVEDHDRNQNDTVEGFNAFLACWDEERPLAEGWGPKPDYHEIHSSLILPPDIEALVFRTKAARDEWFPRYLAAAQENYDGVQTKAALESVTDGRRTFEFRSVRDARKRS